MLHLLQGVVEGSCTLYAFSVVAYLLHFPHSDTQLPHFYTSIILLFVCRVTSVGISMFLFLFWFSLSVPKGVGSHIQGVFLCQGHLCY